MKVFVFTFAKSKIFIGFLAFIQIRLTHLMIIFWRQHFMFKFVVISKRVLVYFIFQPYCPNMHLKNSMWDM